MPIPTVISSFHPAANVLQPSSPPTFFTHVFTRPSTPHTGNAHSDKPFEHAPEHAHDRIDGKDERSHKVTIDDANRAQKLEKKAEEEKEKIKPTDIAKSHGNEPSKGAKKDEELENDDDEELRKKDMAKAQSKEAHKTKH